MNLQENIMERSNYFQFNPRIFEDQLSVFGRKVLNVLVQKWNSDQNESQKSQHNYRHNNSTRNRRVLTFRDATLRPSPAPVINHDSNITSEVNGNQPLDFNFNQNAQDRVDILTTSRLIQTLNTSDALHISEDISMFGHDLINPVIQGHIPNEMHNGTIIIDDLSINRISSNNDTVERTDNVDWDNMFDFELFSAKTNINNAQLVLGQTETQTTNKFNIEYSIEAMKKPEPKTKRKCNDHNDNNDNKKPNRKNRLTKDTIPMNIKKISELKTSFRKQKYTRTVKNWLNDVDSNNLVEINEKTIESNTGVQTEITIEKVKDKSIKKVIQAQLANRNGTMKYKKPKSELTNELGRDKTDESSPGENNIIETVERLENNNKGKEVKDKSSEEYKIDKINKDKLHKENKPEKYTTKVMKNKSKFVAPIKSQIPVKDVDFRVTTVKGNDTDNHMDMLNNIENQELVLVLIYCNGYCQLNYHHTEDTCDPDGFILGIHEEFFYFKGDHQKIYKATLQCLLEKNKFACYDGKSLLMYLKSKLDLDVYKINIIDTKIGGSILDPDIPPENFSELQQLLSYTPQFTIATECILQKAAWYATLLKECAAKLVHLLIEEQLWDVFMNLEMKLLPIISEMENLGVGVDLQKIKSMEDILLTKMKATELECHKVAGKTFQINSPVQVRALIYDELKLDTKCNMKIRETLAQGAKSTSESMLRGLVSVHPLPRLILEYRHLHKAHATFLTGIAQHVKDGVVRPTWVQTAAATGRIASNNPNLQAIPKAPFNLVLFPALSNSYNTVIEALSFRSVYTSRAGYVLLACDFKHIECRVFAHAAADEQLLAVLRTQGDLFKVLAHKWLNKPESEVTIEDRERTKRIVYASLYGAGVRKLMDILAVGYEQALAIQTSFNRTFPSLKSFGQSVVSRCVGSGGRLATLCGRVRRFKNITSGEYALKAQAERQAVNFIVQGSAADLCKMAMVEACAQLRNHSPPLDARLLLQIHDELVWEVKENHLHSAAAIIKRAMEGCGPQSGMEDALPVAVFVGYNWGEMKEYYTELQ